MSQELLSHPHKDPDLESESESEIEKTQGSRKRGIYLLPNLFTTAALFCGFYAIIQASNQAFESAAIAIFVAMIMDSLDGRVARMTNTQSAFGAQYDSLSDMVSFGIAPALVAYHWALHDLKNYGWICAFLYSASTALRLARFNVQLAKVDKKYFVGLPSPAAAALVAGFVWFVTAKKIPIPAVEHLFALIVVSGGLFMVSNILYYSFKELDFKGHVPFMNLLGIVLVLALVSFDPSSILCIIFAAYAFSGPLAYLKRKHYKKIK
ncbi:MAG: CDP-diacylglycerol--serine O-phosphatidyltransferase [Gammaproteobacteria bacterium]